jgi:hypothetical protein
MGAFMFCFIARADRLTPKLVSRLKAFTEFSAIDNPLMLFYYSWSFEAAVRGGRQWGFARVR